MVYNRCIGTRTCSSYCPYKVRRFNWFDYRTLRRAEQGRAQSRRHRALARRDGEVHLLHAAHRGRACQRPTRKTARIADGEVVTACQQACPTSAIVFGDLNDPKSAVAKRRDERPALCAA